MPLGRQTSLLDDPRFLAELEQIDIPPRRGSPVPTVPLGDALAAFPDLVDEEWSGRHPEFNYEAPASPGWSIGRIVLAFVGFLLMMAIGGAAATVVFHSRVAQILAHRPISAASSASSPATGSTPR